MTEQLLDELRPSDVYDRLNDALYDLVQGIARCEREACTDVVSKLHAQIAGVVELIESEGIAR